jgi:hypothetical protein
MAQNETKSLGGLLDSARSVAILLPRNPSIDGAAAALALKLSLEQSGKTVFIAAPDPVTVEFNRLVGVNTITQDFGKRDLVISFPGQTEMVDKVSYNVDRGELQLVVTPKAGTPGLDPSKLKFIAGGQQADLLILIGTDNLQDLGQIYDEAKENLTSIPMYPITGNHLSHQVLQIMKSLKLPLNGDIASNLLSGLEHSTSMYQTPDVTPEIFETAALLMRQGARRNDVYSPSEVVPGSIPTSDDSQQVAPQPQEDWYEPKVYRGTNLS